MQSEDHLHGRRRLPAALAPGLILLAALQHLLFSAFPEWVRPVDDALIVAAAVAFLASAGLWRGTVDWLAPAPLLVAVLVLFGILSALADGVPPAIAGAGLFVTFDYVVVFLAIRVLRVGRRSALWTAYTLVGLSMVATGVALLQHVAGDAWPYLEWQVPLMERGLRRVPSLFPHPSDLGIISLTAAVVAGSVWLSTGRRIWLVGAGLAALGVVISMHRVSQVVLVPVAGLGIVLASRRFGRKALFAGAGAALLAAPFVWAGVASRIAKLAREGGDARLTYLGRVVDVVSDHPFLGVGPGRFGGEVAHRFSSPIHESYALVFNGTWSTVDSFWVHLAGEMGFVGVALFLALLAAVAVEGWQARSRAREPVAAGLAGAVPALVGVHVLLNVTAMGFEANNLAAPFWILAGIGVAAGKTAEPTER